MEPAEISMRCNMCGQRSGPVSTIPDAWEWLETHDCSVAAHPQEGNQ